VLKTPGTFGYSARRQLLRFSQSELMQYVISVIIVCFVLC